MFKVGDKVRVIKVDEDNDIKIGSIGTITDKDDDEWFSTNQLELASIKPRPVNFLLKYDLNEDPIEEFETMDQVNDRIKALLERSDLKRDSMVVYEIKSKRAVSIETKIKFK